MDAIQVRRAMLADAAGIARAQVATWRTTYRGLIPDAYLDAMEEEPRAKMWEEIIARDRGDGASSFVMVAVTAGTEPGHRPVSGPSSAATGEERGRATVGFAAAGPERSGDPEFRGELGALYVLKEYQGRGLGRRLVTAAVRELLGRGHASMLVWVLAQNPYRRFYESLGGVLVRSRTIEIGGVALEEWGYGWPDLEALLRRLEGERQGA